MDKSICSVDSGSPIEGKVKAGDILLSINGHKISDVLDYKFYAYDKHLDISLRRPNGEEYSLHVKKDEGGDLGLDFESYLMDRSRSCANNCVFCFIDQLPKGLRPTMYFKDDDTRLSFLMGNYITLTNLSDREAERIIALHISPINVSVHTMNAELRCRMLQNPRAGESLELMRRFAEAGITMNCQIVCCPGINDGQELLDSMKALEELHPGVHSVSVVPVGLTKYRQGLTELTPFTKEHAAETIDLVTEYGDGCLKRLGTRLFFCGDELYLKAERELPEDAFYEEYTQLENGVGMLRLMETEFNSALRLGGEADGRPFSIATGVAAAPLFKKLLCTAKAKYDIINGNVYTIENDFFGHSITVAGLVTGGDLIKQLKGKPLGERLLISGNMLRRNEQDFLDGVTLAEAERALGVPIYPLEQDGFDLFDAICGELKAPPTPKISQETEYYKYNKN